LEGGSENDLLDGGTGRDTLKGDSGDDVLFGGSGRDDFYGGDGDDTFVFLTGDTTAGDNIYDLTKTEDSVDLTNLTVIGGANDGLAVTMADLTFSKVSGTITTVELGGNGLVTLYGVDYDVESLNGFADYTFLFA